MQRGTRVKCKSHFVPNLYNEAGEVVSVNGQAVKVIFDKDKERSINPLDNAYWFYKSELEEMTELGGLEPPPRNQSCHFSKEVKQC